MRFLKLALFSIIFLFIGITGLGLLFPSTVVVSRATDIVAPKDSILTYLSNINQWKQWVEGMKNEAVIITSPTEANLVGTTVSITSIKNYTVQSVWTGKKGTVQQSTIQIYQDAASPKAVVHWQFVQNLKWYPWDRLSSMMNDKIMGEQLEKNLANLQKVCERR